MKIRSNQLVQCCLALSATLLSLSSCKKDISANPVNQVVVNKSNEVPVTIPIGVALNGYSNATVDSVYVLYNGEQTLLRAEIPLNELPRIALTFQQENYANNSPISAYTLVDADGNTKGFISIIRFNARPVAIEYGFDGVFAKVLEQREWADLDNDGWHTGGLFEDRGGSTNNTIDINSLPDEIKNYMANTYPDETISKALKTREDATIVLTNNIGSIATIFNSGLAFQQHIEMSSSNYQMDQIEKTNIPAEVLSKISYAFPNYVFEAANRMSENGTNMGSLFLINANNTHYAITTDINGNILFHKVIF